MCKFSLCIEFKCPRGKHMPKSVIYENRKCPLEEKKPLIFTTGEVLLTSSEYRPGMLLNILP